MSAAYERIQEDLLALDVAVHVLAKRAAIRNADLCAVDGCPHDAQHFHPDRYVAFCDHHFPNRRIGPAETGSWDGN